MQALVLGGVIGALGGVINALATRAVLPDNFSTVITFFAYTALILGGAARTFGPIVGSVIFWMLLSFTDSILREASRNDLLPASIISGTQVRSEEHTSELQSLMSSSYAVFCLQENNSASTFYSASYLSVSSQLQLRI